MMGAGPGIVGGAALVLWAVRGHAVCSRYYHTGVGGDNQMEAAASLPPAVLLLVVLIQG